MARVLCFIGLVLFDFWTVDGTGTFAPTSKSELQTAVDAWTSDATSAEAFYGHISGWDTSAIVDMSSIFSGKSTFNDDISGWDTSSVTNMNGMFNGANAFDQDISSWDVSKVTNMGFMFNNAYAFNKALNSWVTSSATTMQWMFQDARLFNQPLSSWNTASVTNMNAMFRDAEVFNQDLTSWDVSSVTDMSYMFYSAPLFNGDISGWDVSSVGTMRSMFDRATGFNSNIAGWTTSTVTTMRHMFQFASAFNQDISSWSTGSVTTMHQMFQYADAFDQDISGWSTGSVTDLYYMFNQAKSFSYDVSGWSSAALAHSGAASGMFCCNAPGFTGGSFGSWTYTPTCTTSCYDPVTTSSSTSTSRSASTSTSSTTTLSTTPSTTATTTSTTASTGTSASSVSTVSSSTSTTIGSTSSSTTTSTTISSTSSSSPVSVSSSSSSRSSLSSTSTTESTTSTTVSTTSTPLTTSTSTSSSSSSSSSVSTASTVSSVTTSTMTSSSSRSTLSSLTTLTSSTTSVSSSTTSVSTESSTTSTRTTSSHSSTSTTRSTLPGDTTATSSSTSATPGTTVVSASTTSSTSTSTSVSSTSTTTRSTPSTTSSTTQTSSSSRSTVSSMSSQSTPSTNSNNSPPPSTSTSTTTSISSTSSRSTTTSTTAAPAGPTESSLTTLSSTTTSTSRGSAMTTATTTTITLGMPTSSISTTSTSSSVTLSPVASASSTTSTSTFGSTRLSTSTKSSLSSESSSSSSMSSRSSASSSTTTMSSISTPRSVVTFSTSSSSSPTSQPTTTITTTMDVVAGEFSFTASSVTVTQVRAGSVDAIAAASEVRQGTEVVDCIVSSNASDTGRRLQITTGDQAVPVSFEVFFIVDVSGEEAAEAAENLRIAMADIAAFAAFVAQFVASYADDESAVLASFAWSADSLLSGVSYGGTVNQALDDQEEEALDTLLGSNDTQVAIDAGGMVTTAFLVTLDDYDQGSDNVIVEVGTVMTIGIPEQVFTDLGEDQVVLMVVELSDKISSNYEEVNERGDTILTVEALVSINMYDVDGTKLEVSDLTEPLLLQFAVPDDVAEPFLQFLQCAVWDETLGEWSFDGIEQLGVSDGILSCTTSHLSLFGMILSGFLDTFECSQASLLTTKGIRQIWTRKDWSSQSTVAVLWIVIAVLVILMLSACMVDMHRIRKGVFWTDTGFFIFDEDNVEQEDDSAARVCGSLWLGATMETLNEVKTILWKSIRDEAVAATFLFLDVLRSACEGQIDMLRDATTGADEESNPNGEETTPAAKRGCKDKVRGLLEAMARQWLKWAVHLKASSSSGVHYQDNYQQTLEGLATREREAENPNPEKTAKPPSPTEASEAESNNATEAPASTTAATNKSSLAQTTRSGSALGMPTADSRAGSGLPVSLSKDLSSAAKSETPSLSLAELHNNQSHRLDTEYREIHSLRHNIKTMGTQLVVHGPIGSIFAFSIFRSCGLRALEFSCVVLGDLAVATFFMSVSGKTRSAANNSSCQTAEDFFELAGKYIALGVATTMVAVVPVVAIFKMQSRRFHTVPFENCTAMKRRMRAWKFLDALVWFLGLAYAGFCTFYVMLFFSNVAPVDHNAWLITACTTFVIDLMITPIGSVLVIFLTLWCCLLVLALWTGTPRKQLIQQLRTTGEQSANLRTSRGSEAQPGDESKVEEAEAKAEPNSARTKVTDEVADDEGARRNAGSSHLVCTPSGAAAHAPLAEPEVVTSV